MKKEFLLLVGFASQAYASTPAWTFTPLTPTSISVASNGTAFVKYLVTNQSKKTHTLVMKSINGVTQDTTGNNCKNTFTLAYHESCTLKLNISGTEISSNIYGGPVVCEQSSANLMCYQPNPNDILHIMWSPISLPAHAYIANYDGNSISVCEIDWPVGTLNNCNIYTGFSKPTGISISNGYAYITNSNSNNISLCQVDSNSGALSSCKITLNSGLYTPWGITIQNGYAYIANYSSDTLSVCEINPNTKELISSSCKVSTNGTYHGPESPASQYGYIYIANRDTNTISYCQIAASTGITSCNATASIFSQPENIAFQNGFAYISNSANSQFATVPNSIAFCLMDSTTGALSNCNPTGPTFDAPVSIALENSVAYIANHGNDKVSLCLVDSTTGELSSDCTTTGSGFNGPYCIFLN